MKLSNITPTGAKGLVIQLNELQHEVTTESGLHLRKYRTNETDGGRQVAAIDTNEKYSLQGTVKAISKKCQQIINEEYPELTVGTQVVLYPGAKNAASNWLILNRDSAVQEFEGLLQIHPNMVQYTINND